MHILLLPSFYPSKIRPSTGLFFVDQINALRSAGHQVGALIAPRLYETIEYLKYYRQLPPLMVKHEADSQIYRLHSIWIPRTFPLISAFIYGQVAKKAFQQYCKFHGTPDIIHAHNIFYGGNMAVQIAQQAHLPIVLTEHSTNFLRGRIFLPGQHRVARFTLQHIDKPLAVGQKLAEHLNKNYDPPDPVETIANIVDTNYFVPGKLDETFTFAAVGQLTTRKRFDLLISAFASAFRNQPAKLVIGGSGKEYNRLNSLIVSLGIESQVDLLGQLSREQVCNLFQRAHVIVSSSHIETFGVTLIEAMSCGKPIIATRSGGPEQFVTPDVGILIPVDDEKSLVDAMLSTFNSYDSFDQQHIRNRCIQQFSQQAISEKLSNIYKQLLE